MTNKHCVWAQHSDGYEIAREALAQQGEGDGSEVKSDE